MIPEPVVVADVATPERNRGGRPPRTGWEKRYLRIVRTRGVKILAARGAGVSYRTVERRVASRPAFAAAVEHALQCYADTCEEKLVATSDKGNPVGLIVRLKALRPELYIEKHAVLNLTATVQLDSEHALPLLRQMLGQTTPTTQRAIVATEATVIDYIDAQLPRPTTDET